jgi:6-phospho-beta-glucosidase
VVLNVPNNGSIAELQPDDVVEAPCAVSHAGAQPVAIGAVPEEVRGLLHAVKVYERVTIQAALQGSRRLAVLALTLNPIVGDWRAAGALVDELLRHDPDLERTFSGASQNHGPTRASAAPEAAEA